MNIKAVFAVIFAFLIGIGGTVAYFYFDKLERAQNAPPIPPAQTEKVAPPQNAALPSPEVKSDDSRIKPIPGATRGAIKSEDLVIGGISVGASIDAVRAAHGEPIATKNKHKWHGRSSATVYEYPALFDLYVTDGVVRAIKLDYPNGIKTSKNISVGSTAEEVIAAYGEPSIRDKDNIVYFVENNPALGIEFDIDHGYVDEIRAGVLK